ncbi:MAG: 30S ribosomal protein S15 [Candidatus Diapherotrites archaeon]|nr:30S ribosomal protein S15 [Candidatus Diapherotrites archaeon]
MAETKQHEATAHSGNKAKQQSADLSKQEIAELISSLSNKGHNASEIGLILRDQHNIHSVKAITGKRITQLMHEKGIVQDIPEDMMNLIKTSVRLQKHMVEHRKDTSAKRGYQLSVSKIRRLAKYYIKERKLPSNWRYTAETAQLLVK